MRVAWLVVVGLVGCWRSSAPPPATPASSTGGASYASPAPVANERDAADYKLEVADRTTATATDPSDPPVTDLGPDEGTMGRHKGGDIATGHGSGSGNGYGRSMRPRSPGPTVSIGQPEAAVGLDKAIIRRYIKRHIQRIQYCYEQTLVNEPSLEGTVVVDFTIGLDGAVSASSATGLHTDVSTCIAQVIKNIEFPKPTATVVVKYPFTFRPQDTP